jgi:hypothetical protein
VRFRGLAYVGIPPASENASLARPQRLSVARPQSDAMQEVAIFIGALGGIRTPDPQIRSLVLYPAELRALGLDISHGQGFAPARLARPRLRALYTLAVVLSPGARLILANEIIIERLPIGLGPGLGRSEQKWQS